jgi:hypothetical protein
VKGDVEMEEGDKREEERIEDLELAEGDSKDVRGGDKRVFEITQDVTVNKAKTADKAFTAMDGYIKG